MNITRAIIAALVMGFVVLSVLSFIFDAHSTLEALKTSSPLILLLAIGLAFSNYLIRNLKWLYMLKLNKVEVSAWKSSAIFFAGLSMAMTPGKLGEFLKAYLLKESDGVSPSVTAPAVIADRLTDLISLLLLVAAGVAARNHGWDIMLIAMIICLILMAFVSLPSLRDRLVGLIRRVGPLSKHANSLNSTLKNTARLLKPLPLSASILLSAAAWGAECMAFHWILTDLGINSQIGDAVFIYGFATVAGAVSMLPGGLVATEGSMLVLLTLIHGETNLALSAAAVILIRLCTLWFAVGLGSLVLFGCPWIRSSLNAFKGKQSLS